MTDEQDMLNRLDKSIARIERIKSDLKLLSPSVREKALGQLIGITRDGIDIKRDITVQDDS